MESNQPLQTFTLFPLLPTELRLKIWNLTIPGPRTVTIHYKTRPLKKHQGNAFPSSRWISPDPNPLPLQICHESRTIALKSYTAAFGSHACPRKIYFDFERDTLSFGGGPRNGEATKNEYDSKVPMDYQLDLFLAGDYLGGDHDAEKWVRRMVVDLKEEVYHRRCFIWHDVRLFTGLQELTILARTQEDASDILEFGEETMRDVRRKCPEWVIPSVRVTDTFDGRTWGRLGGFEEGGRGVFTV